MADKYKINLYEDLPTSIKIDGKQYKIACGFKSILLMLNIFEKKIGEQAKINLALKIFYCDNVPSDKEKASDNMKKFIAFSVFTGERREKESDGNITFDYLKDSGAIYTSFLKEFGIDLLKDNLHWFKFQSLLASILFNKNSFISKICSYRSIEIKDIKDEKEKEFYLDMKSLTAINKKKSKNRYQSYLDKFK